MSLLAPLYLIGAAAIAFPILFHLIRRRPQGKVHVSSLMFLQPTPPKLTRRSRLENLPLLLIRCLALTLLALAFARPFFRGKDMTSQSLDGKRVVLLIDRSASMRRSGLWQDALADADATIEQLATNDQLSIVAFDTLASVVMSWEQSAELTPNQRKAAAREHLRQLAPTWRGTNLGDALRQSAELALIDDVSSAVDESADAGAASTTQTQATHLVLITDLQTGSNIDALQAYPWPESVSVELRLINAASPSNATAHILAKGKDDESVQGIRVRVTNAEDAKSEQFQLAWTDQSVTIPAQVPAGASRVVTVPYPETSDTVAEAAEEVLEKQQRRLLELSGDDHPFDNLHHYYVPPRQELSIPYLGPPSPDADDEAAVRRSLAFFLFRVPLSNAQRNVEFVATTSETLPATIDPRESPLIVVGQQIDATSVPKLKQYLNSGGRLLVVLRANQSGEGVAKLCDAPELRIEEADVEDYAMLRSIRFADPIFASMSDPQFNDFTKVRFWKHRNITGLPNSFETLARFDDDSIALAKQAVGKGTIWIMAAGWMPDESQLALSTKFLPLVHGFFDPRAAPPRNHYQVDGPFDFPITSTTTLWHPDGSRLSVRSPEDWRQVDQPGIYQMETDGVRRSFAVNMSEQESQTTPLAADALERFGITVGKPVTPEVAAESARQLRDIELESKQRWWQWLLVAAVALLAVETVWGGMLSQRPVPNDSSPPSSPTA